MQLSSLNLKEQFELYQVLQYEKGCNNSNMSACNSQHSQMKTTFCWLTGNERQNKSFWVMSILSEKIISYLVHTCMYRAHITCLIWRCVCYWGIEWNHLFVQRLYTCYLVFVGVGWEGAEIPNKSDLNNVWFHDELFVN